MVQRAESMDVFGHTVDPPADEVKVVAGFVDGKTSGVFAHTVPAVEVAGAVFDVDIPGQVDVGDATDLAVNDQFTQLAVDGVVTVVEGTDKFAFGVVFGFDNATGIGDVGGHRLFADDIETEFQTADDVVDVVAVFANNKNGIDLLFFDHAVKDLFPVVEGHRIFSNVLALHFRNQIFANLETQRVDIQHRDQLGAMAEALHHGTDVHTNCACRNTANSIPFFCHSNYSLTKLFDFHRGHVAPATITLPDHDSINKL